MIEVRHKSKSTGIVIGVLLVIAGTAPSFSPAVRSRRPNACFLRRR